MYGVSTLWNRMKDGKQDSCAKRNYFNHSMCLEVFCINLKVGWEKGGFCFLNCIVNATGRVIHELGAYDL